MHNYPLSELSPPPPPPPPEPASALQSRVSEMDTSIVVNDEASISLWDWSEFLDFNIDDHLGISLESDQSPAVAELPPPIAAELSSSPVNSSRVRKRDARMTCENFLAGRVPCACPEIDEKLAVAEEEEAGGPGKKRPRTSRVVAARCQVPGCEADISKLKGYHKRHRVCLSCANATAVLLDGQSKRYCQQCGKFHILPDFDEGKRSCRRKLERHNNRRRKIPPDSKGSAEREPRLVLSAEDDGCDDEAGKDTKCTSSQAVEGETVLDPEVHNSALRSTQAQNIQNDSITSFAASGEIQTDEEREKYSRSPSYCEDKSGFSSVCPTGRISFKLYDWNPAEFPRRLRHQIFTWLSSMPVELEGYIRPGCTILTLFTAMPKFMWVKLLEDPDVFIHRLLASPRSMLSGRGTFLVNLNSMVFRVMKDGTSVIKVNVEDQAPKLHCIHPICFEAGKPMEFVACGSNLLQPKFRFLVSFAGKYLTQDVSFPSLCNKTEGPAAAFNHQLLKIYVPHTELNVFGPGFIEVENESGLSNFIPIIIADREICSELRMMEKKFYSSLCSRESKSVVMRSPCEAAGLQQRELSEFILDMAWLLKEPAMEDMENILTSSQLQRFTCLLNFLIKNESTTILERMLYHMKIRIEKSVVTDIVEADMRLFQRTKNHAKDFLDQHKDRKVNLLWHPRTLLAEENDPITKDDVLAVILAKNQDMEVTGSRLDDLTSVDRKGTAPLLNGEFVMSVSLSKEQSKKSYNHVYTNPSKLLTTRPLIFVITSAAVCFGICVALLHPQKATSIATTIRRCLFDNDHP